MVTFRTGLDGPKGALLRPVVLKGAARIKKSSWKVNESMEKHSRKAPQIQSVVRASEILEAFTGFKELGLAEIARQLDLNNITTFGMVNTLTALGYLEQVQPSKKYRLGLRLLELGNLVQRRLDVREEARRNMVAFSEKYNALVHLAIYSNGYAVYIDKVEADAPITMYSQIGRRAPMYCTAVGKAMLAFLPKEYFQEVVERGMEPHTANTIVDGETLWNELCEIRKTHIAVDRQELEEGLICIATPIFDRMGKVCAAMSISFPYGKIKGINLENLKDDLRVNGREISERLGFNGAGEASL